MPVEDRKAVLDLISVHPKFQALRNFTVNSGETNLSYNQVKSAEGLEHTAESKQ